ncbi:alpha/beta hydrolase [Streptomyces niveus]|uniref:Alpha/beta hydrolase family protein n=1 Tax=Streptomyces niveus TaxID=193462 RepID=A0ABZ2A9B8_STRNV|nr:alpha/beta hydrolase [Streptomyces niveus]
MTSLTTLRDVKPAEFEQAADGYQAVGKAAHAAKDRITDQATVQMRGGELRGEALTAALKRLERLSDNFHYTQVECGLISLALNGFAAELRSAQKKLNDATGDAVSAGFTVRDDGSVHWEATFGEVKEDADFKRAKAQGFADRIGDALGDATKADQKWAPQLERLKAHNDLTVSDKDWGDVHNDTLALRKVSGGYLSEDDLPDGKSPAENAKWWRGLTADERAGYTALYPASVGALDGLPSDVRDDVNRTVLEEKRAKLQLELDSFPKMPRKYQAPTSSTTDEYDEWEEKTGGEERMKFLEGSLNGMGQIQERFDRTGTPPELGGPLLPQAYLLGFDPEGAGDGRVIIANGNPDTADHTAVYVPGTGAGLPKIGGDLTRGETLWSASQSFAPGKEISTITWLDYETPRSAIPIKDGDFIPEATDPEYAQKAAPALNQFMSGVQEAQGGPDGSHTTIVGHSYGSTAIGEASKHGYLAADDIVVAGSPGMQTSRADNLDVDRGHVWAMAGSLSVDQVPTGGRLVGLGDDSTVPTDRRFGANIMRTDTEDHSGYWRENSISLTNQAAVITGKYDEVELE